MDTKTNLGSLTNRVLYQDKLKIKNPKIGIRNRNLINDKDWTRIFVQIAKNLALRRTCNYIDMVKICVYSVNFPN